MKKPKVFMDMDGVLCKFQTGTPAEDLYKRGYFKRLPAQKEFVKLYNDLCEKGYDVYILSAYLADSKYARMEKYLWLDTHISIEWDHRILLKCGESKAEAVKERIGTFEQNFVLIDDYSPNCLEWDKAGGAYIKVARDLSDASCETKRHKYVVSPDMNNLRDRVKEMLDRIQTRIVERAV